MEAIDRLGWVVQDNYEIDGMRIGIRYTSERLADLVRSVLAPFETQDDAAPTLSVNLAEASDTTIRKLHVIYRGSVAAVRTLSPRRLLERIFIEAASLGALRRADHIFVVGTGSVLNGSAALLPYWTGTGRDRLASALARRGVDVVDGTVLAIDMASGSVVPFPLPFEVPADVYAKLAEIAPEPGRTERGVADVPGPRPLGACVVWGEEAGTHQVSRAAVVHSLAAATHNRRAIGSRILEPLAAAVTNANGFAVWPDENAIDTIAGLLAGA
jgi:hypothetical protein